MEKLTYCDNICVNGCAEKVMSVYFHERNITCKHRKPKEKMKLEDAVNILERYNLWRVGDIETLIYSPKVITEAINTILDRLKTSKISEEEWLSLNKNTDLFPELAKNNCLCKFDDGTICRFNDDHPNTVLTHFKVR